MKFKVKASDELFSKFIDLSNKVRMMNGIIQNNDSIISTEQLTEWRELLQDHIEELTNLKMEVTEYILDSEEVK